MPAPSSAASSEAVARARTGVALLFVLHGVLVGGWAPHIPLAKAALEVGPGLFGWLLLAMAGGGVLAMPLAGALINRFGSAAVCRATALLFCPAFALPTLAETPLGLAGGLAVFGAALGSLDVAMNAHGVAVETRLGRPTMSAFHGWYSVGAAGGAALGGLVVGVAGPAVHVALTVAGTLAMLAVASPRLLAAAVDRGLSGAHFGWPTRATLGLGALGFLALFVEGAMLDWSALRLVEALDAPVETAGLGFAAFSTGMAAARFAGDALRARFGSVALVAVSAAATAAGIAAMLLAPALSVAAAALTLAGLGVGNIAPVLFAGGGRAEPDAPGRGIAAVTTLSYSGFLLGPPSIGGLAELVGLGPALWTTVAGALAIALAARAARAADARP